MISYYWRKPVGDIPTACDATRVRAHVDAFRNGVLFANGPQEPSYVESQFYALSMRDDVSDAERIRLLDFINSRDSGSGFSDGVGGEPTVFSSFYCCCVKVWLKDETVSLADRVSAYLLEHQKADGGFGAREERAGDVLHTFWILAAMDVLHGVGRVNKDQVSDFMTLCYSGDGWGSRPGAESDIESTAQALVIADLLGLDVSDDARQAAVALAMACRINGRFGEVPGAPASWGATLHAIYTLVLCGEMADEIAAETLKEIAQSRINNLWTAFCMYHACRAISETANHGTSPGED